MTEKRARDYGVTAGSLRPGARNKITDVPGVQVGHCTVDAGDSHTGVTVLLPCRENPFIHKLPAAAFVLNGFGKTAGLVQVDELGTLETPIAFTNTLNVGLVHDALVEYMLHRCGEDGTQLYSVNPIVCECNDSALNDISRRAVGRAEVLKAFSAAGSDFAEGGAGAGRGMVCHGLKGGIGSASRLLELDGKTYTLGVLVLANHGILRDLTISGRRVGAEFADRIASRENDQGSCIAVVATDLPLDARQLGRVARRVSVGLARLGSYVGHGSGEIFIAFSTANAFDPREAAFVRPSLAFHESKIDLPFRAAAECAEEAVLNCLFAGKTLTGFRGKTIYALSDLW